MRVNPTWTLVDPGVERDGGLGKRIDVERTDGACPGLRSDDGAQAGSRADVDDTPAGHLVRMLHEVAGDPEPTGPRECPERYARVGLSQLGGGEARGDGDIVREMEAHAREIRHGLEARRSPNESAAVGGRRTGHRVRLRAGQRRCSRSYAAAINARTSGKPSDDEPAWEPASASVDGGVGSGRPVAAGHRQLTLRDQTAVAAIRDDFERDAALLDAGEYALRNQSRRNTCHSQGPTSGESRRHLRLADCRPRRY